MVSKWLIAPALVFALGSAAAQSGAFSGQVPVNAALKGGLSSRNAKVGQAISAVLEKPATIDGTAFPRGSMLLGHVVDVTKHAKTSPNGSLTVVFDHIKPKSGDPVAVHASIYRIALSDDQITAQRHDVDMGMRGSAAEMNTTSAVRGGIDQNANSVQGMQSGSNAPVQVVSAIPGVALSAVVSDEKSGIMSAQNADVDLASGTELVVGVKVKQ